MRPDGMVNFGLYELLKILGKNRGGDKYEKVRKPLDRIAGCVIYAKNAFHDNESEQFRTYRFTPRGVHFASTRPVQGRSAERHVSKFHELLVRSYNSWFLKTLETDSFSALKTPMAKGRRHDAGERRSCAVGEKERGDSGRKGRNISWEAYNLRAASLAARY
jgi:hypothetical protein